MSMCEELENKAHVMKLFMHFQAKTNLDLGL
jgi:hypothetical protein